MCQGGKQIHPAIIAKQQLGAPENLFLSYRPEIPRSRPAQLRRQGARRNAESAREIPSRDGRLRFQERPQKVSCARGPARASSKPAQ